MWLTAHGQAKHPTSESNVKLVATPAAAIGIARQCAAVPLRRGTSPAEVGHALLAILSLPAMTGQMIALDGGQHLQWGAPPADAGADE